MLYIKRNEQDQLLQVEKQPFEGMTGQLPADDAEVLQWQAQHEHLLQLRASDQDMVRVLEDLIYTLMEKGVLSITDLPAPAQAKLIERGKARDALAGDGSLMDDEETIFL